MSASPPLHLFESPLVREVRYTFLPEAVLSTQATLWAETTVDALDHPRDKRSAFFDFASSSCILCGSHVVGGYNAHRVSTDHVARLCLVTRVLGLLYTFYSQVAEADPTLESPLLPSRRSRTAAHGGGPEARLAAAQSCYHQTYSTSFLFDEEGVPDHDLLHHRPQLLQELDLVDVLLKRWWRTLHHVPAQHGDMTFRRILSLSSDDLHSRLHRLRYLLFFLVSRGVLRDSVEIAQLRIEGGANTRQYGVNRHEAFERFEMLGDLEFKLFTLDRLRAVFPADEGGVEGGMFELSRVLDSNHGLLDLYDYLNLDGLLSVSLANNKTKADVVEALVGELRALLWSTEVSYNTDTYDMPGERATAVYLHAVVEHTLYELAHVAIMWRIDSTLRGISDIIKSCIEKEFSADRHARHRHGAKEISEAELSARAPRNALQPLLLPWERQHGGVRTSKDEAQFALLRRPARPSGTFQAEWQQKLTPSPAVQSAEEEARLSKQHRWKFVTPAVKRAIVAQVMDSLAPDICVKMTLSEGKREGLADAATTTLSACSAAPVEATVSPAMPDLQLAPCPRNPPRPSLFEMQELIRINCIVLREPLAPQQ